MSTPIEKKDPEILQSMEDWFEVQVVGKLKELGVDTDTADPAALARSIRENGVRFENLMYVDRPEKSGVYFYKHGILVSFVPLPRFEGIDITNWMGDLGSLVQ